MSNLPIQGPGQVGQPLPNQEPCRPTETNREGNLAGVRVQRDNGVKVPRSPSLDQRSPIDRPLSQRSASIVKKPVNLGLRHEARYRALPTKSQLIEKAGRPKDDIKFWFFGSRTKRMSTGYKAILKGVENYQKTHGHTGNVDRGKLQELRDHLETLKDATKAYSGGDSHTRKAEIAGLNHQVRGEIRLLDRILKQMDNEGATWPEGVSLKEGLNFTRQGVKLNDLLPTMVQDYENSGMEMEEFQSYRDAGFSGAEARILKDSGLGLEGGKMFRDANLKVTMETLPGKFRATNEIGCKKLGSGAFNTVYKVSYNTQAGSKEGVFKPLPNIDASVVEGGWVASMIGVNCRNPQTAMRNLATLDVAKELGFDVVPDTTIAEHGGKLGLLMDQAEGTLGCETSRNLFEDPGVRRELTKLQILDALVAQGDRHGNNYFINKDPNTGKVKVTGIDNDQCLGNRIKDPNGIARGNTEETEGFRGVKLPPVIDSDMAAKIRDLDAESLKNLLGDKLAPSEVIATITRLDCIKEHVEALREDGRIIDPNDWGSEKTAQLLTDKTNSYVARDIRYAPQEENSREQDTQDIILQLLLQER